MIENLIPAQPNTEALVTRYDGVRSVHRVHAWALIAGRVEALVHINSTGELTPVSVLRDNDSEVVVLDAYMTVEDPKLEALLDEDGYTP